MAKNLIILGKKIPDTSPQQWQVTEDIVLEWGRHCISLGEYLYDNLDVLKIVRNPDDELFELLKDHLYNFDDKESFKNNPYLEDIYNSITIVSIPLPSPRTEIDFEGNEVIVTSGSTTMTLQEAIDKGITNYTIQEPTFVGQ